MEQKINGLITQVSEYDIERFAGFFACFIKKRPDPNDQIELNKFDSKLKDFFYLIALNIRSSKTSAVDLEFSPKVVAGLADQVNAIKDYYRMGKFTDYTMTSVIHEMAFRNHFDNGVLSYVEQDLEKIRTVFSPFEKKIKEGLGFDIDFLIEVYKVTEMVTKIRSEYLMGFSHTQEFKTFLENTHSKQMNFDDAFELLPEKVKDGFLSFHNKTHAYLLFSKEDLYQCLDKEKVDKFLAIFSCNSARFSSFRYYTDPNPIEVAPIIEISENKYLHICQKQIPIAIYKVLYDFISKDDSLKDKLRRHREKNLEKKVATIFKKFFGTKEAFYYENYYVENGYEQDLLIIYKGAAIVIEIKASKLREPFRDMDKAVIRLKNDFKQSVQEGFNQCKRTESKFNCHPAFDITNEKGNVLYRVNPSKIHSVHSIVVTLERFGSLQTDLNLMLDKEPSDNFPWSVYVDDLEIFLLTLKHHVRNGQGKFLDFLRYRRQLHGRSYAIDELDICAVFLKNPEKFYGYAKMSDTGLTFSPLEQGLFDEIYYSGKLKFEEQPYPDFQRYFGKENPDSEGFIV